MPKSSFVKSLNIAFFIGLRYSKTSTKNSFVAFINTFSVIGISLGIAALITVLSVMNGLEGQLKQRILGILPHIVAEIDDPKLIEELEKAPIVQNVTGFIEQEAIIQSRSNLKGVFVQGVDSQKLHDTSIIANNMLAGSYTDMKAGSFNVVISRVLANQMDVRIGGRLRVISTVASSYSPFGRLPSQRLVTVAGIFEVGSEMDDKVLLMHVSDLAKLSRKSLESVSATRIDLYDAFLFEGVTNVLKQKDIDFKTWRERQGQLFDAVKMEKNMMSLMLMLVIAVAAFNVISALVMVVSEKTADIAILQTQGLNASNVLLIFLLNGLFNGLKGIFFGLVIGTLLVTQLNPFLSLIGSPLSFGPNGQGLPIDVNSAQIVWISIGSLVLCILATLYPASQAAKIHPARSLQEQ
ncbi:lipoprotein-releasing ABC transporter permease subunit [Glaciecola sp. KUL10]|uniref:lipoprotein-releasing ABC transporter permease subunit n=1 Tax=Glaciecola sp. (strain KUL10) TaxID=2161813 RepID=UPI000D78BD31|nr:lipoprotein-releasing ABC transporter permease subunit [Glaciecola sp. KUL10]